MKINIEFPTKLMKIILYDILVESCCSFIPFSEDGISLGGGPAAGRVLEGGGSSACGDSSGKVS